MNLPIRYDLDLDPYEQCNCMMEESKTGDYVRWEDYEDLLKDYMILKQLHADRYVKG